MSHPLPATQSRRREKRIVLRLIRLLEALDLPDRKALLPARFAGEARRTLQEAEAFLGQSVLLPEGTRSRARTEKLSPYLRGGCNMRLLARWRARLQTSSR